MRSEWAEANICVLLTSFLLSGCGFHNPEVLVSVGPRILLFIRLRWHYIKRKILILGVLTQ